MVAYFDNNLSWGEQTTYDYPYAQSPSLFYNATKNNQTNFDNFDFYKPSTNNIYPHFAYNNRGLCESDPNIQNQRNFPGRCLASVVPDQTHPQTDLHTVFGATLPLGPDCIPIPPNRPVVPHVPLNRFGLHESHSGPTVVYAGYDPESLAPCQGPKPWNYAHCYGYYGEQPCQYIDVIDIEDFMSNEKRKEKSRDAARCRRSREHEIFTELGQVLPLQQEEVENLDKASIMRLSIAYLKVRDMLNLFPNVENQDQPPLLIGEDDKTEDLERKPFDLLDGPESYKYLSSALDGFLLILSGDGDVTYVSESISEYLGISQIDLLGQQIWEYTHQCDHDELKDALNIRRCSLGGDEKPKDNAVKCGETDNKNVLTTAHRDIFLRLKCTLTSRGRSVNIKSASYKVIHLTGHMIMNAAGDRIFIGVGRPLPHPSNIEIPLGSATFLTKHSLDMKFTYVDDKMLSLLGYEPEDLLGKSLYDCHHGADSESLMTTFKSVLSKGQGETCRYRFLGKCGGYCWVLTQATIVYDKQKPQSVVCVNYAISELENNNEIYSCSQLEAHRKIKGFHEKDDQQPENHQPQSKYYPPQKLRNVANIKNNTCADDIRLNATKTLPKPLNLICNASDIQHSVIKRETATVYNPNGLQSPPLPAQSANIRKRTDDISLSPIRRTFNNWSISAGVRSPQSPSSPPIQLQSQDKCPKSVTASVFTQVPINNAEPITVQNQQQQQQPHSSASATATGATSPIPPIILNQTKLIAPAKSVTASVFTPISSLTRPINRAFLPINLVKNLARNSAINSANKNQNSNINNNNCKNNSIHSRTSSSNNSNNKNNTNIKNATGDMNSRYLMFSEESPELTMLKEEPDDLTHLAPSLDDSTQLFGEMLDSLMLPDAYGSLLSDDINSLDSQQSGCNSSKNNNNNNSSHHIDPFINYRDESSDTSSSPHLLSPGSMSKSPEMSSIPSLCSPNSLSQDDDFALMTMNVEDDIDLTMRAPYIPMNEQDDLPLLTEDLMWSAFSEELSLHKEALQMEALKSSHNSGLCSNSTNNTTSSNSLANTTTTVSNSNSNTSSPYSSSNTNNKNNNSSAHDNNNMNDNESSLAALLCGSGVVNSMHSQQQQQTHNHLHHHHHQQQQQQQQQEGNDNNSSLTTSENSTSGNDCKRRKILLDRNDNFTNELMDSIDDFSPVFHKNSSVDCWTMNDLLQLENSAPSSPTGPLHQQLSDDCSTKQNIIINTAIPTTTIHVPLITIQNKNSNIKLNCVSNVSSNNNTTNTTNNTTSSDNSSPNTARRHSATLLKGIPPNITQNVTMNGNCNMTLGKPSIGTIIKTQTSNCTSKRPSNIFLTTTETKRVKNSPIIDTQTSPQLLQQLMAPSPQRPGSKMSYDKLHGGNRWTNDNDSNGSQVGGNVNNARTNIGHQQSLAATASQTQASNSVLKNLLVSGCDDAFINTPPETILDDAQLSRSLQNSPQPDFYSTTPLACEISADPILCRPGANPLIGGACILPSPPMPADIEGDGGGGCAPSNLINIRCVDPLVAGAFSPGPSESNGSDSGIDSNRTTPLLQSLFQNKTDGDGVCGVYFNESTPMDTTPSIPSDIKMSSIDRENYNRNFAGGGGTRKISFSFLDEDNPLCSPFLMDLCNDDYTMNEPLDGDFLQENEITKVLSDLITPESGA